MSQSSTIGFALIVGFVVYVTVRGELPAYLCVIGFGANCQAIPQSNSTASQGTQNQTVNSGSTITAPPTGGNLGTTITGPSTGPINTLPNGYEFPPEEFPPVGFPTTEPVNTTTSSTIEYPTNTGCAFIGADGTCYTEPQLDPNSAYDFGVDNSYSE